MPARYRIENISKAVYAGKNVKIFDVYEYNEDQNAYIFKGQYDAPVRTSNANLINYLDD